MECWYTLELEIKVEHREQFLAIFQFVSQETRKEPGVLQYDLLQNTKEAHKFNLIQRYASNEALKYHMNQPYTLKGMMQMSSYLAKPYVQSDYVFLL